VIERLIITMAMLPALMSACTADAPADATAGDGRYTIIATTAMIGDVAHHVGGDRAHVETLMGPGVDPHLYRPTRGDVRRMLRADVVLYNGLHLEGRMIETFERLAKDGRTVVPVAERIDHGYLLSPAEFEGAHDPHVWMDVRGWMRVAAIVAEALGDHDLSYAAHYRANAERYSAELDLLDAYARQMIASIPDDRRVLVTAHDAFNYFARAYDIDVQPIQGISTDSEAGLRRIEELVDLIVQRRIPAVFTETSVPDRNVRALIEGAKARGHDVRIGGELFSDAMGPGGTHEGTYVGMIDHNVTTVVRALGGDVPEGGYRAWKELHKAGSP
jgi:manganese/zinc/iron transport system substrate-binding protein